MPTIVASSSPKRTQSLAARAASLARQWVTAHECLPTLAELRLSTGGGSERDLVQARRAAQSALEALLKEKAALAALLLRADIERECQDRMYPAHLTGDLGSAHNVIGINETEVVALKAERQTLQAQLAEAHALLDIERRERLAEAARFEGMRLHLLLETARIRDELAKPAFVPLPGLRFNEWPGEESQAVFERK